jgi:hypothetical protein
MRAMNKIHYSLIALALLLFAGCEKDNPPVFNQEVSTAVHSAAIDVALLYHLGVYADAVCTEYSTGSLFCWNGVTDSVNGNAVMLEYNFDIYQLYGCGYYDTAHTGGVMKIQYTAPYPTADTLLIQLTGFHTMGNTYNGNLLIDRSQPARPRVTVQNLTAGRNGFSYSVTGSVTIDILQGRNELNGSCAASGGQTYTLTTQSPLVISTPLTQQLHFNTGKALFTHPLQNGSINYGNGAEDKLATFATPDGLRYVLTLQNF